MLKKALLCLSVVVVGMALVTGCGQSQEAAAPAADDFTSVESSLISGVKYDAGAQQLVIQLTDGETYAYDGVAQDVYDGLMAAESKGAYFQENIKDKFETTKL